MSRNNSFWWNFSSIGTEQSNKIIIVNNINEPLRKIEVLPRRQLLQQQQQQQQQQDIKNNSSSSSSIKVQEGECRSNSITSETSTDIPDNASTTTTLVEQDNHHISTSPTSDAIPIPKIQNSQIVISNEEQKNKYSSSFRSWWSFSSSSSTSTYNQKDNNIIQNNNNSMEEKQKTSISNLNNNNNNSDNKSGNSSRSIKHDKQLLKQDNGSSISILTPINEDDNSINNDLTKSSSSPSSPSSSPPSSSSSSTNKLTNTESSTSKLSSSYPSNNSSRSWWMFGGGGGGGVGSSNHVASREVVSSNNITTKPEQNNIKGVDNESSKKKDQVPDSKDSKDSKDPKDPKDSKDSKDSKDLKDSKNHISSSSSSITSDGENSSSNVNKRKVTKKSSSEIRRWSLFNTWSSSTPNLLELSEGENSKNADDDNRSSKSDSHPPPSSTSSKRSSSSLKSEYNESNDNATKGDDSSKVNSQNNNNDSSKNSKNDKRPRNRRRSTNPLINTLPENSSSWVHFFTSTYSKSNNLRIDNNRKMITDGSSEKMDKVDKVESKAEKAEKVVKVEKKGLEISSVKSSKTSTKVSKIEVEKKDTSSGGSPSLKPVPANVILPTFEEFAKNKPRRRPNSMVQQALHAVNSYFFPPDKSLEGTLPKWLDEITRSTVDVKRIAIIGIHGWFPARLVRAVVGEPTGTSPKFCDMMAKSILGYLSQHGIDLPSDAITCIPLEGEGTISTREELLHKNLLYNKTWCQALSLADVVFVATHSQGTPVSTILLSRLIKEGLVHPRRQRICMLAMAGISHGPFPYLKENYIVKYFVGAGRSHDADAARELFEFMNSESLVSKKYREELKSIIQSGVKTVYVASMDDQVVPLYSGLFNGVDHPSIMRAIYIDGPSYQSNDFLTNLIVFAVRLRNAGILDHGLMVQLSEVVAGSMYGEGHSALYTEIDVYTLAVRYLFETPTLGPCEVNLDRFVAQQKNNPYYLPWAMRGILEDKGVLESRHFAHEVLKLRKLYENWEPTTKVMKDVKFRLEPLKDAILSRSKL